MGKIIIKGGKTIDNGGDGGTPTPKPTTKKTKGKGGKPADPATNGDGA